MGGFSDKVTELFEQELHVCDQSKGWTNEARNRALGILLSNHLQKKIVPALTPLGFEKTKIPKKIYAQLLTARKRMLLEKKFEIESCDIGMQNCAKVVVSNTSQECHLVSRENYYIANLDVNTAKSVFTQLKPMAEKWIKNRIELVGTSIYGIRKYTRGAWLLSHLDHLKTHVVSAILNIKQNVEEDWPLQIFDHDGNIHEIILAPGEMVWYESAKLVHARIKPLKGKSFENVFVHYMPRSMNWYNTDANLLTEPVEVISLDKLDQSESEYKERRMKVKKELEEATKKLQDEFESLSVEERMAKLAKSKQEEKKQYRRWSV